MKHFYENQKKITNNHILLGIIQYGFKINITEKPQYHNVAKIPHNMLKTEINIQEVKKLTAQKMEFSVTFTEEILNGKLHFLCSDF